MALPMFRGTLLLGGKSEDPKVQERYQATCATLLKDHPSPFSEPEPGPGKNFTDTVQQIRQIRSQDYDQPINDFTRTAGQLTALGFCFRESDGTIRPIAPTDVPCIMICAKLSRQMHKHKPDNLYDISGYADCWLSLFTQ